MLNSAFYHKISLTLLFTGLFNLAFGQTVSKDPCKDIWVVSGEKIVMFIPEDGEKTSPVPMPVRGSSNENIVWTWKYVDGPSLTPESGVIFDKKKPLNAYFDVDKVKNQLGGTYFETSFTISGTLSIPISPFICNAYALVKVLILARVKPYDAITPNGDDLNDYWAIDNISSYPEATITVIDRWGVSVFEGSGETYEEKPFRGKLDGKLLPTGVYMYRIKPNADYPEVVGSLTIIR
jgi:gliding motility-associated-like protein